MMPAALFTQPEEFEPKCEWVPEDGCDTLLAHVPGYKKENLKVQVTTAGNLRVLGERIINDKISVRFQKEFSLSQDCDLNGITAKFEGEVLQVRIPKKALAPALPEEEEAKQETKHTVAPEDKKPHDKSDETSSKTQEGVEAGGSKDTKEAESSKQNERSEGLADVAKDDKPGTEEKYQRMHPRNLMPKKTTLIAVLILAVAVALGLGMVRHRGVSIKSYLTDGGQQKRDLTASILM